MQTAPLPVRLRRNRLFHVVAVVWLGGMAVPGHAGILSFGDIVNSGGVLLEVGRLGAGSVTVDAGSSINTGTPGLGVSAQIVFGSAAPASGTGLVTGAGSLWDAGATGDFIMGRSGTGTLTAEQGGRLTGRSYTIGELAGSNGTLTIDNATFTATNLITAGSNGTGTLNIRNGGTGTAGTSLGVGISSGSSGTVNIDGAGSGLTVSNAVVGALGTGAVNITNGGRLTSTLTSTSQAAFSVGANVNAASAGSGTVIIDGAGSRLNLAGIMAVGLLPAPAAGGIPTGTVTVRNAGTLEARAMQLGFDAKTSGSLTVAGAGSTLHLGTISAGQTFFNVGRAGTGQLDVVAGGKVLMDPVGASLASFNAFNVGGPGGANAPVTGNGVVNVTGSGSEIRQRGDFVTFGVGRNGTGTLNVTGGGQVVIENLTGTTFSTIGRATGATGVAVVDGAGSLWQAGNKLFIGTEVVANAGGVNEAPGGGTGTLTIANGGRVTVGSLLTIGAGGTLRGGGGTVEGSIVNKGHIAPGNSPGILTVHGDLTLTAAGNLDVELGGTSNANPGAAQFDQINAFDDLRTAALEGRISVGGRVNVVFVGGFHAHAGDFFDILTGLDITQVTPDFLLPVLDAGLSWDISEFALGNGREALRLSVIGQAVNVPAPGVLALLGIGLFRVLRRRDR